MQDKISVRLTIVSTVVMPSETLAGDEVLSSQKDTHDKMTIRVDGKYIWIM